MTTATPSNLLPPGAHAALMDAAQARADVLRREAADRFWRGLAERIRQALAAARHPAPAARATRLLEA
ncbi:MAG: hypothetical protein AB7I35_19570 [Ramlibacter sp.]